MKCHWRAFFELSELSAESLRQVTIMPQDAKTIRATQDCSKLGTTTGWMWCPEYAKVKIKWSQTQMCTIRRPVALITGDITSGTS